MFIDPRHTDGFYAFQTVNVRDRVPQKKGNIKVMKALHFVPDQSADIGQNLYHRLNLGPFKGKAAGHDHPHIPGTQYDEFPAREKSLYIHISLRGTGSEDARRPASPAPPKTPPGDEPAADAPPVAADPPAIPENEGTPPEGFLASFAPEDDRKDSDHD